MQLVEFLQVLNSPWMRECFPLWAALFIVIGVYIKHHPEL